MLAFLLLDAASTSINQKDSSSQPVEEESGVRLTKSYIAAQVCRIFSKKVRVFDSSSMHFILYHVLNVIHNGKT